MIGFHWFKTNIDSTRAITEKRRKDTCKQTHDSVKKIAEMSIRSREERARGGDFFGFVSAVLSDVTRKLEGGFADVCKSNPYCFRCHS